MTNTIRVDAELSIKEGQLEEFKKAANAAIAKVNANEPNTFVYEWYLSDDGSTCCVSETYKDSDAVMAHLADVGDLLGPLLEVAPLAGLKMYGNVSEEVRQAFDPFGTQFYQHFNGVTR